MQTFLNANLNISYARWHIVFKSQQSGVGVLKAAIAALQILFYSASRICICHIIHRIPILIKIDSLHLHSLLLKRSGLFSVKIGTKLTTLSYDIIDIKNMYDIYIMTTMQCDFWSFINMLTPESVCSSCDLPDYLVGYLLWSIQVRINMISICSSPWKRLQTP